MFSVGFINASTTLKLFFLVFSIWFLMLPDSWVAAQQLTSINGIVLDASTKDPLAYVTIQSGGGKSGVRTDINGHFYLEASDSISTIKVSYVGYLSQIVEVQANQKNQITVYLSENESTLKEVRIRPQKYQKNNPAVDLIAKVFENKDLNRKESLSFYQFEKYEQLRLDLNGVTEKYRKKWYFSKFRFVFDYCDTNRVSQKVALPFYFRERLVNTYYRGASAGAEGKPVKKEKLLAEHQTAFDDGYDIDQDGISNFLNQMYADVDIYEPTVTLLDKQFIGPLSSMATGFYRFYITDTVLIGSEKFADVFFAPKNKNDLAFMGNILVALDSTYAVRRVEMGISKDINLNWVSDLRIEQDFEFNGKGPNRRLMLSKDRVILDMKIIKNKDGRSVLATKTNTYRDYQLNTPLPDSLFASKLEMLKDTGDVKFRTDAYWAGKRHYPISITENEVGEMIDTVKQTRTYKILQQLAVVGSTGFQRVGKLEIGELADLYSFNDVEGDRAQLSLRTQDRYSKKMRLKGFGAYGFKDQAFKYGGNATISFKGARPGRFPANQVKASYTHDLFFPGLASRANQSLLNSVQRGGTNRLLLNNIARIDYSREYEKGFSYSVNGQYRTVQEAGLLDSLGKPESATTSYATELGSWIRFAPKEKFYQTRENRIPINNRWPVFYLQYRASVKGLLGGEYGYQRASMRIDKFFYISPYGKSRVSLEYGRIFGQVSYPFLEIPRANQTYFFDDFSYSLMNYLEFVTDQSLSLRINHDLEGLILNRIPLIKKLNLREGFTFKALLGNLSARNIPNAQNKLIPFPLDPNGQTLTRPLGRSPYIEASAGISNILSVFRIDYVWRLTYRHQPNIDLSGPRLSFGIAF